MRATRDVQVRVIKANPAVMRKASELLREESAEQAETYLKSKGLMDDDEMLCSEEVRIAERGPYGVTFSVAPVSFGVVRRMGRKNKI
jgi:hypothetical protein